MQRLDTRSLQLLETTTRFKVQGNTLGLYRRRSFNSSFGRHMENPGAHIQARRRLPMPALANVEADGKPLVNH